MTITNAALIIGWAIGLGATRVEYTAFDSYLIKTNRVPISFMDDPKTESVERNYWHSGYDRGHLAPAADFTSPLCRETLESTYLMSNISPMKPRFNRGEWANIEAMARSEIRRLGTARVVTVPVYGETTNRCGRLVVPTAFLKMVYTTNDVCVAAWVAENVD